MASVTREKTLLWYLKEFVGRRAFGSFILDAFRNEIFEIFMIILWMSERWSE